MADKNVLGKVVPATEKGFADLLVKANEVYPHLTLIGVVQLGSEKLGGVFVRLHRPPPADPVPATPGARSRGNLLDE